MGSRARAVIRAPPPPRRRRGVRFFPRLERVAQSCGILPSGLCKGRPSAAAAADVAAELAHELHRVEPLADERVVEVDDEIGAPVVDGADDHPRRLLLLPHAVGQVAELPTLRTLGLDEDDVALPLDNLKSAAPSA